MRYMGIMQTFRLPEDWPKERYLHDSYQNLRNYWRLDIFLGTRTPFPKLKGSSGHWLQCYVSFDNVTYHVVIMLFFYYYSTKQWYKECEEALSCLQANLYVRVGRTSIGDAWSFRLRVDSLKLHIQALLAAWSIVGLLIHLTFSAVLRRHSMLPFYLLLLPGNLLIFWHCR
jgi:hypothetical protein